MNPRTVLLALSVTVAALTGCSSAGDERALVVCVRDAASHEAIRNAVVRVEPQRPIHPFDVKAMLFGAEAPEPDSGFTDAAGKVRLRAYAGLPMTIVVGAAGRGVETYFFEDHPAVVKPGVWMQGRGEQAEPGADTPRTASGEGIEALFAGE